MAIARKYQIPQNEAYYINICTRTTKRSWVCGVDPYNGVNYEHRRQWITDRLRVLGDIFAIEIATYAVMSNHYHLVLHVNPAASKGWSDKEVVARWNRLYPKRSTRQAPPEVIDVWRQRLANLSWFMKSLNEYIARKANKEDGCTGHFWEARFHSQLLLDDAALIACMAYVDLNPIRAKIVDRPEEAEFTGLKARLDDNKDTVRDDILTHQLLPFIKTNDELKTRYTQSDTRIAIQFEAYLELVDFTGRQLRLGKRGAIPKALRPILDRLDLNQEAWIENIAEYGSNFHSAVGPIEKLQHLASKLKKRCVHGHRPALALYFDHSKG